MFPETLMFSWLFRQAFSDFTIAEETNDVPPVPDQSIESQLYSHVVSFSDDLYLRQRSGTRDYLKGNFLPIYFSDYQISNFPANWAITHYAKRSALALGYMLWFFIPLGEMHRILKVGAELGVGLLDNEIKIKFCGSYSVPIKIENNRVAQFHDGKYNNPKILESIAYKELVLSY